MGSVTVSDYWWVLLQEDIIGGYCYNKRLLVGGYCYNKRLLVGALTVRD